MKGNTIYEPDASQLIFIIHQLKDLEYLNLKSIK